MGTRSNEKKSEDDDDDFLWENIRWRPNDTQELCNLFEQKFSKQLKEQRRWKDKFWYIFLSRYLIKKKKRMATPTSYRSCLSTRLCHTRK